MHSKKILVVGGAGFIGSQVNKMLHDTGYDTVVYDNLSTGIRKSVNHGTFIEGDLADELKLDAVFKSHPIGGVMHFAARIEVGESMIHPAEYYQNNVVNTIKLFDVMLRNQVDTCIFSSTAAVYGIPLSPSIEENHPCYPINPYGQSKLMVEKILHDYHQAYGLKYCSLRYFNAAGGDPSGEIKNFKKKETNLIPIILRTLQQPHAEVTVFGTDYSTPDGTCIRDYIHVHDLGDAHIKALERLWSGGASDIYNLGNGQGFSVLEVIETIQRVTQTPLKMVLGQRRLGDPPILVANADKAKSELNWKPMYPDLEAIVRDAWKALQ